MDKNMIQRILAAADHTNLSVTATREDILKTCEEACRYGCASACIPSSYVKLAHEKFPELNICTVIGFPNGYTTTAAKCFEAKEAVENGASEIDMVINIGMLKDGRTKELLDEINMVKAACGDHILKVIIETCLLTEEEKICMCGILSRSDADFIKTSTGFSKGGATVEDVKLLREHTSPNIRVKAAGGISTMEDAAAMLEAGASRLGTSRIVKLMTQLNG